MGEVPDQVIDNHPGKRDAARDIDGGDAPELDRFCPLFAPDIAAPPQEWRPYSRSSPQRSRASLLPASGEKVADEVGRMRGRA